MPLLQPTLKSRLGTAALALGLALLPLASQAGDVSSRYGALDGLGIGVNDGDSFEFLDLVNGQPDGTNEWTFGGFTAQVDSAFTGQVIGASLQVYAGGWGSLGPAQVYLNQQRVGQLSLGEDANGVNTAHLDRIDLTPYLPLLGGQNQIEIRTADPDDGGVLGYLSLLIQTQDSGGGTGGTLPEPASWWLVAAALAACLLVRGRRRG